MKMKYVGLLLFLQFVLFSIAFANDGSVYKQTFNVKERLVEKEVKDEEKRGLLVTVGTFVGQHIARYVLNKGFAAIENAIFGNNPMDVIKDQLQEIQEKLDEIKDEVSLIGGDVLQILVDVPQFQFSTTIMELNYLMISNLEHFRVKPEDRDEFQRNQVNIALGQILHSGLGIDRMLRRLHVTILGTNAYGNESIIERHYNQVMRGRQTNSFQADEAIADRVGSFLDYLLQMQEIGFSVWYAAMEAQYIGSDALGKHLKSLNDTYEERLLEQNNKLNKLFPDCSQISLEDYPVGTDSLRCKDGMNFGSVCYQDCAGPCKKQNNQNFFYPPVGYKPLQCLKNGTWSNNEGDSMKTGCSFCSQRPSFSFSEYPSQCYRDASLNNCTVGQFPGHTLSGEKCQHGCLGKRRRASGGPSLGSMTSSSSYYYEYWCYTDLKNNKYDVCVPDKIRRNEAICDKNTVDGRKCLGNCRIDKDGYFFCYLKSGKAEKQYCN